MPNPPLKLFISYSQEDELYLDDFLKHLAVLQHRRLIEPWHDRCVLAGEDRAALIDTHIDDADIIVVAVSADFLATDDLHSRNLPRFLARHYHGSTHIIPIILRATNWQSTDLYQFQPLPRNGVPISNWPNRDAWLDVIREIERVAEDRMHSVVHSTDLYMLQEEVGRLRRAERVLKARCATLEAQLEEARTQPWCIEPLVQRRTSHEPRFRFRTATARSRILSATQQVLEVYHEVVAIKRCRVFQHSIGRVGEDETRQLPAIDEMEYEIDKRLGDDYLQIQLRFGHRTRERQEYFIDVIPELKPNQELGYWRQFRLPNHFPLSRAELRNRAKLPGFRPDYGSTVYGDHWDVLYDIDSITTAVHFPWSTRIASRGVRVFHYVTREENPEEVERCAEFVRLRDSRATSERVLELTVPKPLINHSYYLLYEPLD